MDIENRILKLSIYSRICLILCQYVFNHLIPDHDAGVFTYQVENVNTFVNQTIYHLLGGFLRWDAHYFMHIANYGYTYENTLAFFPLYPISVRLISILVCRVLPFVSFESVLLIVFIGFNVTTFILANLCLFKLTTRLFDENFAYKTSIVFCFNPASIFFIAPYTECLFSFLTFRTILNCLELYEKYSTSKQVFNISDLKYLIPIGFSTISRSNGLLNVGFLVYTFICLMIDRKVHGISHKNCKHYLIWLFMIICSILLCILPFLVYQYYCYYMFCNDFDSEFRANIIDYANLNDFVLPGTFNKHNQSWCYKSIPLAYSYVQSYYWDVGFFKYYQLKQIPNFLLSFPIVFIFITNCLKHLSNNFPHNIICLFSFNQIKLKNVTIHSAKLNVFVIHSLFLTIFCVLFIHIQVTTRMLCSSTPYFYWLVASSLVIKIDRETSLYQLIYKNNHFQTRLLKLYFVVYFFMGNLLFVNFLPWT